MQFTHIPVPAYNVIIVIFTQNKSRPAYNVMNWTNSVYNMLTVYWLT